MNDLGRLEDLPADYVQDMRRQNLVPLWPSLRAVLPPHLPARQTQPTHWAYQTIKPLLLRAGELTPIEKAERRVLVLSNPGLGPDATMATPSIYLGLQLIQPGETAPCHKHTPSAIRFVIEGSGGFTSVQGEKLPMEKGDLILTPAGMWHEHGHEGKGPVIWLDALDLPLMVPPAANSDQFRTAFTVTVDLRVGTTTGISAHDRAATVLAVIDPETRPEDIARPGHIAIHGAVPRKRWAEFSIEPHDGAGGCSPRPRKDMLASAMIAVAMVTAVAIQRLRDSNREGLLWALTIAAERKVPLHHAAWAFAGETTDTVGSRAWQIGDALEQGASLPLAIEYVGLKVSTEVAVAARVGQSIDHLSGPLREALTKEQDLRTKLVPLLTQVVYLAIVAGCSLFCSLFASLRLVPVMRRMLAEVGVEADEMTTIPWYLANLGEMLVAEFSALPIPVQAIFDLVLAMLFFAIVILLVQFVFRAVPRNQIGRAHV